MERLYTLKEKGTIDHIEYEKRKKLLMKLKPIDQKAKTTIISVSVISVVIIVLASILSPNNSENQATVDASYAAKACQETIINNNLINRAGLNKNNIELLEPWDANNQLYDQGGYDDKGNNILLFQWNGKNKMNDNRIRFSCWFSRDDTNNSNHFYYIAAGNVDLAGRLDFDQYDAMGEPQQ
ncbi:MAG: hypothetical protein KIG14_00655 [Candidatus Sacchiramonaceae bacterium]|nr:hypothetical protein [Candidatus Saccharimonadaceae bacterium]